MNNPMDLEAKFGTRDISLFVFTPWASKPEVRYKKYKAFPPTWDTKASIGDIEFIKFNIKKENNSNYAFYAKTLEEDKIKTYYDSIFPVVTSAFIDGSIQLIDRGTIGPNKYFLITPKSKTTLKLMGDIPPLNPTADEMNRSGDFTIDYIKQLGVQEGGVSIVLYDKSKLSFPKTFIAPVLDSQSADAYWAESKNHILVNVSENDSTFRIFLNTFAQDKSLTSNKQLEAFVTTTYSAKKLTNILENEDLVSISVSETTTTTSDTLSVSSFIQSVVDFTVGGDTVESTTTKTVFQIPNRETYMLATSDPSSKMLVQKKEKDSCDIASLKNSMDLKRISFADASKVASKLEKDLKIAKDDAVQNPALKYRVELINSELNPIYKQIRNLSMDIAEIAAQIQYCTELSDQSSPPADSPADSPPVNSSEVSQKCIDLQNGLNAMKEQENIMHNKISAASQSVFKIQTRINAIESEISETEQVIESSLNKIVELNNKVSTMVADIDGREKWLGDNIEKYCELLANENLCAFYKHEKEVFPEWIEKKEIEIQALRSTILSNELMVHEMRNKNVDTGIEKLDLIELRTKEIENKNKLITDLRSVLASKSLIEKAIVEQCNK